MDHIRPHDVRHTAASLWLAAGFKPYEVSRWLGHANLVTTDTVHGYLSPPDYSSAIERFELFVSEGAATM
ncbi:integrase [Cryobacterium sp. CG_9.6]|nr:integrase [Cryobacterium sp. CG_9.6]